MSEKATDTIKNTLSTDQELAQLVRQKHKAELFIRTGLAAFAVMLLIILAQCILGNSVSIYVYVVLLILIFGPTLYGGSLRQRVINRQKSISMSYTPDVLRDVMDRLDSYERNNSVNHDYLRKNIGFPSFDQIGYTGNYVKGVLRGIPLEFSEFILEEVRVTEDSDGDTQTEYHSVFEGVMVVCRHGLELDTDIVLSQYSDFNGPKTENEEFNRTFSIYSVNSDNLRRMLTPDFMEQLIRLSRKIKGTLGLRYCQDGTLLIVLKDWNMFEVNDTASTADLINKIRGEVNDLGDILDLLNLPSHGELMN